MDTSATAASASLQVAVAIPDTARCSGRWSSQSSAVGNMTKDDFRLPRIVAAAAAVVGVDNDDGGLVAAGSLPRQTRT